MFSTTSTRQPVRVALLLGLVLALHSPGPAPAGEFLRGDTNGSGNVDISDALGLVQHLFSGGDEPRCPDAADSDDSGTLDLTDAIFTLGYLFLGGSPPPAPGPETCGADPTADVLGFCGSTVCGEGLAFESDVLRLPSDHAQETAASFVDSRVRAAIDAVLNSEGDAILLHLEGTASVSVLPGVPVIVEVGYDPTLTLVEGEAIDVGLSVKVGGGIGLELAEGVEASLIESVQSEMIFRFPDKDEAVAALESILAAQILLPLSEASVEIVAAFDTLVDALGDAVDELEASRAVEAGIRESIAAAQRSIRSIEDELGQVAGWIGDRADDIRRLEDLVDTFCGKLLEPKSCDTWRSSLRAARRALESLEDQQRRLQSALAAARSELSGAQALLQPAVDAVRSAEEAVDRLQRDVDAALADAEAARGVIAALAETRGTLEAHLSGMRLRKATEASVEAFLSPFPGVTLEGAGVGAEASTERGIELLLTLTPEGTVGALTLTVDGQTEVKAKGALGVGVQGAASMGLAAVLAFEWQDGVYEKTTATMELEIDAEARAVAGVGLTFQYGVGRNMTVAVDLAQLGDVARGLWDLADSGEATSVIDALLGFEAVFASQDRRVAAAVAGFGASYLGTGGSVGGSATWSDKGPGIEEVLSVNDGVRALYATPAVSSLLELLSSELEGSDSTGS